MICLVLLLLPNMVTLASQYEPLLIRDTQITEKPQVIDIQHHLKVWIDSSGSSSFSEVKSGHQTFSELDPDKVSNYGNKHSFWLHLKIQGGSQVSRWYLGLRCPEVTYYHTIDGINWESAKYGYRVVNHEGTTRFGSDLFIPIHLNPHENKEFYFHCNPRLFSDLSQGRMADFHIKLSNRTYIYLLQNARLIKSLPLAFILLTIFFYHLILFLYNREKSFLYLSLFSLSSGLLVLNNAGYLIELFGVNSIGNYLATVPSIIWATLAVASPFTVSYLDLDSAWLGTRLIKLFGWLWVAFSAFVVLTQIIPYHTQLTTGKLNYVTYLVVQSLFHPCYVAVGLIVWSRGNIKAIYYLLGFGSWFIGSILSVLFTVQIIPGGGPSPIYFAMSELPKIGSAIGMLFFSFGLARQFKTLQEERAEADKQKALSDQLRQLDQKEATRLQDLDQFKSQLYTNITHEFRTPLTVISGMADQLDDQLEEKTLIQRNTDNLLDLVNQMLDLSKLDAGKLQPNLAQTDLVVLLKYLSETYDRLAASQDKKYQLELLEESFWLDMDSSFLERIINNLVHNAIKFSPPGGAIKVRLQKIDQEAVLSVSDQGRGIPPGDQEKIFDRFYQVDASATRQGEGTGIGLALAKELVTLLDGKILVKSELGNGSTFAVILPITHKMPLVYLPHSRIQPALPILRTTLSSSSEDRTTILIVEDHSDVRRYLYTLLSPTFQLLEANNGRTGISLASEHIPDLIISDIMMPEMDGFALCQKIKADQRTSHIPVILLTAKSTHEDKLEGLQEGADAYLIKPFDKRELFLRINNLLNHQQKMQLHFQQFSMLPDEKVEENKFLDAVKDHLKLHIQNENHQIEDLAQSMHLGRIQIFRKLKALTGKTYTTLIREMRIHRAKELLKKTDKTINEIAFEAGFKNGSYFGKVFKKEVGMSAGAYRRDNSLSR